MAEALEELRDYRGRRIGVIETQSDGSKVIWNPAGRRLGSYNPRDKVTRDVAGRIIGYGNLLVSLLRYVC